MYSRRGWKSIGVLCVLGLSVSVMSLFDGIPLRAATTIDATEAVPDAPPGAGPKTDAVVVSNVQAQQFGSYVRVTYDLVVTPPGLVSLWLSGAVCWRFTADDVQPPTPSAFRLTARSTYVNILT